MLKRIVSGLLVNLAIFLLTTTFLVWLIDGTVLSPGKLNQALHDSGTNAAIAKAIPELATKGMPPQDLEVAKPALEKISTPEYVEGKLSGIVNSFIKYVEYGSPEPILDLSDVPAKLEAANLKLPPEQEEFLLKPIKLTGSNSEKTFNYVNKGYQVLKIVKVVGPALIILVILLEWAASDRRHKFSGVARIFFSAGFWAMIFWFGLNRLQVMLHDKAGQEVSEKSQSDVLSAVINGAHSLLSNAFVVFGVSCLSIAVVAFVLHMIFEFRNKDKSTEKQPESKTEKEVKAETLNQPDVTEDKPVVAEPVVKKLEPDEKKARQASQKLDETTKMSDDERISEIAKNLVKTAPLVPGTKKTQKDQKRNGGTHHDQERRGV